MALATLSGGITVKLTNNHVATDLAGDVVILNLADGSYYGLNEVGSYIWKLLQSPMTVQDICVSVAAEYDVDERTCRDDVFELLETLAKKSLVEMIDEDA